MISNIYPNYDPDTAAKKLAKDLEKNDDHDRISQAFDYIADLNLILVSFELELKLISKQKTLDSEEF
jgi:hypothetical protein